MTFYDDNDEPIIMDGEDAHQADEDNRVRAAALKLLDFFREAAALVKGYRGNQLLAFDCLLLAMGWWEVVGVKSQVELARRYSSERSHKAAVNKCVKMFQDRLGIGPMPGQRDAKARQKFAEARKKQLGNAGNIKNQKPKK